MGTGNTITLSDNISKKTEATMEARQATRLDQPAGHQPIYITFIKAASFILLLYLFLLGIGLLGGSFKLLGKGVAEQLIATTSNPFAGLFIGILTTSIVQSSSVTTSIAVALVSGGALSIHNAVPIVMGANIGTTITSLLVSLGHIRRGEEFKRAFACANMHDVFNLMAVIIILPIQLTTGFLDKSASMLAGFFYGAQSGTFNSPIKAVVKPVVNGIHGFMMNTASLSDKITGVISIIIAALFIFAALTYMVKCMRALTASKLEKSINRVFSANIYLTFIIGIMVTAIIQSSSITTSMLVPVVGAGLITLEQAFPVTIGANIGTTVTALMAALAGNQAGLTIAFVHLIFNICGTLLLFVPPWTRGIPLKIARFMAGQFITRKKLALVYILLVFFILPIAFMFITRNW